MFFLITASFGYFKNLNQRTGWFQVFGGNQNQRTISSRYFKTLKEPANYCQVCNLNLNILLGRSQVHVPQKFYLLGQSRGQVFQILASAVIYAYIPCLNLQWVFDPKSKNHPTLVESGDFL
jgi:hypothetical protein